MRAGRLIGGSLLAAAALGGLVVLGAGRLNGPSGMLPGGRLRGPERPCAEAPLDA